jgi:hypothetical protein
MNTRVREKLAQAHALDMIDSVHDRRPPCLACSAEKFGRASSGQPLTRAAKTPSLTEFAVGHSCKRMDDLKRMRILLDSPNSVKVI